MTFDPKISEWDNPTVIDCYPRLSVEANAGN